MTRTLTPGGASVPASRPRITAALRSARAFDAALQSVIGQIDNVSRSYIVTNHPDDRLRNLFRWWTDVDIAIANCDRHWLVRGLSCTAAYALIWATTGQRNYVRGCKAIAAERQRQRELLAAGKIKEDLASPAIPAPAKFRVLFEECGEVAHAIDQVKNHGLAAGNIHTELIQVAAVSVAWLESLEGETDH